MIQEQLRWAMSLMHGREKSLHHILKLSAMLFGGLKRDVVVVNYSIAVQCLDDWNQRAANLSGLIYVVLFRHAYGIEFSHYFRQC